MTYAQTLAMSTMREPGTDTDTRAAVGPYSMLTYPDSTSISQTPQGTIIISWQWEGAVKHSQQLVLTPAATNIWSGATLAPPPKGGYYGVYTDLFWTNIFANQQVSYWQRPWGSTIVGGDCQNDFPIPGLKDVPLMTVKANQPPALNGTHIYRVPLRLGQGTPWYNNGTDFITDLTACWDDDFNVTTTAPDLPGPVSGKYLGWLTPHQRQCVLIGWLPIPDGTNQNSVWVTQPTHNNIMINWQWNSIIKQTLVLTEAPLEGIGNYTGVMQGLYFGTDPNGGEASGNISEVISVPLNEGNPFKLANQWLKVKS